MGFTVVDAETGIAAPSVALDITLNAPQGEPPVFRPLTKRVPLQLDPCKDGTAQKCSREDNLGATGFIANAVAQYLSYLPDGPVDVGDLLAGALEPHAHQPDLVGQEGGLDLGLNLRKGLLAGSLLPALVDELPGIPRVGQAGGGDGKPGGQGTGRGGGPHVIHRIPQRGDPRQEHHPDGGARDRRGL